MPNNVNIAEMRALLLLSPNGPFDVECYEQGEGPDRSLIVFIRDADERPVLVDEGPYAEDGGHPSPLACLVAGAINALPALLDLAERAQTARNDALREAAEFHKETAQLWPHDSQPRKLHESSAQHFLSLIKEPTDAE